MGGCRCTFRTCPVSSQKLPKMTFFHYPLKKEHIIGKWIEYADYGQLNEMAASQAKNKAICALHFRDECFMNYKKNRLTPTAVPTLDRLTTGEVLDYTLGAKPKPITLPPTKDQHLIPPPGVHVWGQPPEFWKSYSTVTFKHITKSQKPMERDVDFTIEPLTKKPKILNNFITVCSTNGSIDIDETTISFTDKNNTNLDDIVDTSDIDLVDETTIHEDTNHSAALEVSNTDDIINIDEVDFITEDVNDINIEEAITRSHYEAACSTYEAEIQLLKTDKETSEKEAHETINILKLELLHTKKKLQLSEGTTAAWELKIKDCEKKLVDLETKCQELVKAKASQPVPVNIKAPSTPSSSTTLTKPQLFNGIKKYLSASMMALVRMEMFGNSEREWKPDEKQVCVELLKLGDNVFKYLRDEWRFRLPPKKMVEEWTNEVADEEEDDL